MEITQQFKNRVFTAIIEGRKLFDGTDIAYSKKLGIDNSVFNRIKKGETDRLISDGKLLQIGKILDVSDSSTEIKVAKTDVYKKIEKDLISCKEESIALIFCDEVEIGKTFCAKNISKKMPNTFYIDCSQSKTKQLLIRRIAKTVGIDSTGKYGDVKELLKYAINAIEKPTIILDDAGYLELPAFIEIIELWNYWEDSCGWYMIGDDTLKEKIKRAIKNNVVGFRAFFSRFNNSFLSIIPTKREKKHEFYSLLVSDFFHANLPQEQHGKINDLIVKCIGLNKEVSIKEANDKNRDREEIEVFGALRRAKTFLKLLNKEIKNEAKTSAYAE
ncbi:ATP-binding protein [Chryseobacterium cucumeris]|uniref:ATP-binding protein n=1 Tax=Chryseobacterium cucumeris TaxID=1813611 RepID=UPI0037BF4E2D